MLIRRSAAVTELAAVQASLVVHRIHLLGPGKPLLGAPQADIRLDLLYNGWMQLALSRLAEQSSPGALLPSPGWLRCTPALLCTGSGSSGQERLFSEPPRPRSSSMPASMRAGASSDVRICPRPMLGTRSTMRWLIPFESKSACKHVLLSTPCCCWKG